MFGKIIGRFFLGPHLGIVDDSTPDTCTLSELVETFEQWSLFVTQAPFKNIQLFTMFETSDVHPDIIDAMKVFSKVIVPFAYLRDILQGHGVNAISLNYYTSDIIRSFPKIIPKLVDVKKRIFLYIGTNDVRKNLTTLVSAFSKFAYGTNHILIAKTNTDKDLIKSPNVIIITERYSITQLVALYNMCDYVISATRGEGVGCPMLEANYFGKPIISHKQGVFRDVAKMITVPWHIIPSTEIPVGSGFPKYLEKVFYGNWWDVSEESIVAALEKL